VVFVRYDANGNPLGLPQPVLTGFLTANGETHGRPTWLAWDKAGALLVSDDTAGIIWRVMAPGAQPGAAIRPVVTAHMKPRRQIDAPDSASFGQDEKAAQQVGSKPL
jgi:YD repeat-containing protein